MINNKLKGILIYLVLAPLDFLGTAIAYLLVNWWAPLFADKQGYLPNWLKWFQTFDASLDQGFYDDNIKGKYRYWRRVRWLYRNPAYGWSYYLLGTKFNSNDWTIVKYNPTVAADKNGITFYAFNKKGYFNFMFRFYGFEFKLGWKAWNYVNTRSTQPIWHTFSWGPEWRVPIVTSIRKLKQN